MVKTGKRRKDFTREEFLKHVWEFKEKNENRILEQLREVGCSCDWSRLRFTMDEEATISVRTIFKKMFDDGLIYRGDYLVNWDTITQTALADDEVEYEEKASSLWYFRYPIEKSDQYLIIATTRPETMLGDVAVAVSPKDDRYKKLIGKKILLPLMNRPIPIIEDHFVDPTFGSGVVKITPAHDPNDYEMAQRHSLPMINIMTPDGKINETGGEFKGLSMIEARAAVVKKMQELGFLEKTEPHTHRVGVSYRSKAVIEPYLSKQWFVKMSAFKDKLMKLVKSKQVKLIPKNWENTYFHWIENLRDWCISRQLWWGHRIPIWHHKDDPENMLCSSTLEDPPAVLKNPNDWIQDEDVLDTWFSSALWPFSTLGWPKETEELQKFYPNATLITGHDILFFWVARMILMGEYVFDKPPFPESFLHGLIYGKSYWRQETEGPIAYVHSEEKKAYDLGDPIPKDVQSKWEKMSKSKGNVIDPLEIIQTYGADAMRLALSSNATQSRQIDLDRRRFEEFKNFANKIWNGARFVFMNIDESFENFSEGLTELLLTLEDRWILSRLNRVIQDVNKHLENYQFDHSVMKAYRFFWDEFCAYYVEISKPILFGKQGSLKLKINKQKILAIVLLASLRLMHPFAPFITEELFQELKKRFPDLKNNAHADPYTKNAIQALLSPACITAPYPQLIKKDDINDAIEEKFAFINQIVYAIRNIRSEMQLPPNLTTDLIIVGSIKDRADIEENQSLLSSLVRLNDIKFLDNTSESPNALVGTLKIIVPLPEEVKEKEKKRLEKERNKLSKQINSLQNQLNNKNFLSRAPQELVLKTKENLRLAESALSEINKKVQNQ